METCIKTPKGERSLTSASFESLFSNSPTAMIVESKDGVVMDINASACGLFGTSREEIIGRQSNEILREDTQSAQLTEGEQRSGSLISKDGSTIQVSMHSSPVETSKETASLVSIWQHSQRHSWTDGTEPHGEDRDSIQRASQHIANVISDSLTPIQGFVSLAQADLRQGRIQRDHLQQIASAADRGANFARDLFAFSKVQQEEVELASPRELIKGLQQELTLIAGDSITVSFNTSQETPDIRISPADFRTIMHHAIRNAAANARKDRCIEITCSTGNTRGTSSHTTHSPTAVITISDNAPHLSLDSSTNAFSPFFSLPEREDPHGLRLPTVKHLMDNHGGSIHLQSTPQDGTSLRLSFPQAHN
ncbi:MAG: PAS domain S-box protein [Verrucomicrobiaceae bacterium]|nr:PAS domain S-box protein [Verrucomicrobiaceae bacterium]